MFATATIPSCHLCRRHDSIVVIVALFVTLIPTTIGALLSAIGIAGMDRLVRFNVLAMSGRAVEAAGDVDTLLLDKTGTITLGNRQATAFKPVRGVSERELAEAAQLASLADETPEGRSIVVLAKEKYGIRGREWRIRCQLHPFTAQTRMMGSRSGSGYARAVDAVLARNPQTIAVHPDSSLRSPPRCGSRTEYRRGIAKTVDAARGRQGRQVVGVVQLGHRQGGIRERFVSFVAWAFAPS